MMSGRAAAQEPAILSGRVLSDTKEPLRSATVTVGGAAAAPACAARRRWSGFSNRPTRGLVLDRPPRRVAIIVVNVQSAGFFPIADRAMTIGSGRTEACVHARTDPRIFGNDERAGAFRRCARARTERRGQDDRQPGAAERAVSRLREREEQPPHPARRGAGRVHRHSSQRRARTRSPLPARRLQHRRSADRPLQSAHQRRRRARDQRDERADLRGVRQGIGGRDRDRDEYRRRSACATPRRRSCR